MWERVADALINVPMGDVLTVAQLMAFEPRLNRNFASGALQFATGLGLYEAQPPLEGFGVPVKYVRTDKILISSNSFAAGV